MDGGAWWAAVHGVAKSRAQLCDFTFTFHFHALEKEMATHSTVLAWRIPGTGQPGGLPSMGSHRVGHDWRDLAASSSRASLAAQLVNNPPAIQETWVWSLSQEDPLVKGTAAHSSILAWRIPWTAVHGVTESDTPSLSLSRFQVFLGGSDLGIQGSGPAYDSVVLPWLPFKCTWDISLCPSFADRYILDL